jgi:hypothetical protein
MVRSVHNQDAMQLHPFHASLLIAGFVAGCGGAKAIPGSNEGNGGNHVGTQLGAVPTRATSAMLAGPLCQGQTCTCRDPLSSEDGGAGVPEPGRKRFEVRVGPFANDLWVQVGDSMLYKSVERPDACFYLDLAPGEVPVGIRGSTEGGLSAAVAISEYSDKSKSWYQTFSFQCGAPGVCAYDELQEQKAGYAKFAKGIHDPCGSVRIKQLGWNSSEAADKVHPTDLAVSLKMEIYKFVPSKPQGSDCSRVEQP